MAAEPWTVQDAKSRLSEVLRRARAGEPQRIGMTDDACVVVSARTWEDLHPSVLGSWLVDNAPSVDMLEVPTRGSHRPDSFDTERG